MKPSDKILLGIYTRWPKLNEHICLPANELAWIAKHGIRGWEKNGKYQAIDCAPSTGTDDAYSYMSLEGRDSVAKELSFLQATDCIELVHPKGFDRTFKVTLLRCGMQRAVKLSSRKGRADLWIRDNRNGLLGLVVTILVSIVIAWITSNFAEQSAP